MKMLFRTVLTALALGFAAVAAGESAKVRFVVFGDNQQAVNSADSGVRERLAAPRVIRDLKPDFVLSVGDLMDRGEAPGVYEKFAEYQQPFLAAVPFFPTMGNHDALGVAQYKRYLEKQLLEVNPKVFGPEKYAAAFKVFYGDDPVEYPTGFKSPDVAKFKNVVPSGVNFKTNYAFAYRNCYFISMETGTRWWSNTPLPWLEKHLAAAAADPAIEHIFVYLHHPLYSTAMHDTPPDPKKPGSGECMRPVREAYEPLLKKYRVRMVFSGHVHNYEHLFVPFDGAPTRPAAGAPRPEHYRAADGIHYLITGGGGGPLGKIGDVNRGPSYQFRQTGATGYHVLDVEVDGVDVTVRMVRVAGGAADFSGSVADRFAVGAK